MRKLSQADMDYAKARLFYWQEVLGVKQYGIRVMFSDKLDSARAQVECNDDTGLALVTVSKDFDDIPWNENDIDESMFHEICEMKYWEIRYFLAEDLADKVIHRLIRLDENTIYPKLRG